MAFRRFKISFLSVILSGLLVDLSGQSQIFTSSGTFTVPSGVTSIVVECWGAGGAGGGTGANNSRGGGGGAGGAYARKTLSVIEGEIYTVTVGGVTAGAQSAGAAGAPSWFGDPSLVYAQGGAGGAAPNGGTAAGGTGSAAASIGDVVFPGGNGANGTTTAGGGGGGGAGSGGAGGSASGITAGTGTAEYGGNGATGRTTGGNGSAGFVYGGGGSGAYVNNNTNRSGGSGAQGLVVVSWTPSQRFTSSGTFTVPAGVTSITIECWGGGGAGGGNNSTADGGGGGGGGAYSRKTLSVVPGTVYSYVIGAGGTGTAGSDGTAGGDTWFGSATTVMAKGGSGGLRVAGGLPGAGGAGGSAAASVGDVTYSGGNGGRGRNSNTGRGGPGGSSAGTAANGVSGPDPWTIVVAAAAPSGGGKGGDGGTGAGLAGFLPGGGGGGSGEGTVAGGNGAGGQIIISYEPPVFYSQTSGDPSLPANWRTSDGYSPADFSTPGQKFIIQNGHNMTATASGWSVSGARSVIEIQNGGILTESYPVSISADADFKIYNGGVLYHNVSQVTVFAGGKIFGDNSTVNYGLAGAQTVVNTSYGNLTLSGSGLKSITAATVNGTLSLEGTATASAAPDYGVSASLRYGGSASQTTGPEFPSLFTAGGGVIIDNPSGVVLNNNRTISTQLTFLNGKLGTGVYTLTIGADATITGADNGRYVNGNLQMDIDDATATKTFEIGDDTHYAPVTLNFNGVTNGTGNITATTTSGDHPNIASSAINPSLSVNRYWTLVNNGVTGYTDIDATFGFNETDKDSGTDYNYFIAGLYSGGTWSYPSAGIRTSTSFEVTNLTNFGSFQIGQIVSQFRSKATGLWSQNSTWEVFAGGSWIPAPSTPNSANGTITLKNPDVVTINTPVTIDELTLEPGARLTVSADVTLEDGTGDDMVVNGTLEITGENSVSGSGSFVLSPGATLITGSADGIASSSAAGSIRTAIRQYSNSANYEYNGTAAQTTGDGLPSTVNNLTINNNAGVTLYSDLTINGTLYLSNGIFSTGDNNLTFLASDNPISRISGTISFHTSAGLAFGTAGATGGAAFTLPDNLFQEPAIIDGLTVYRTNGVTLNNQQLGVKRTVLCHGPLNTSGNLLLLSDASGTALIDGSGTATLSGNVTMQRYLPSAFGYKYISSPFQSTLVGDLADDIDLGSAFPSLYRYDENRTVSGWVSYTNPANVLNPLQGFSAQFGTGGMPFTADLTGAVNNGALSVTLYNHNQPYTKGFNLVGNPYPSPIDWDAPSGWTKTNIDDALYFFKAGVADQYTGTYSSYINGISSDGIVSGIIPSMQGFLVHVSDGTYPVTGTLACDNRVRVNNFAQPFSKSGKSGPEQYLRLKAQFTDDSLSADPMVVYFDAKASILFDRFSDGLKLFNTNLAVPNLYSVTPDNYKLSVNGLPPMTVSFIQIPLGLKTNRAGTIEISLAGADESTKAYGIYLVDAVNSVTHRLDMGQGYSVALAKNEYTGRFYLNIGSEVTGVENPTVNDEPKLKVYESNGIIVTEIGTLKEEKGLFSVINTGGQTVFSRKVDIPCRFETDINLKQGFYMGVLETGTLRLIVKFIITGNDY